MFHHTIFQTAESLPHQSPPLKLFHTTINWTNQVKYLGVNLDSKLTYKYHNSKSLCAANYWLRQFHPILNKSSAININLVLTIYKSLFRSTLTYATPAWWHAADTHFNKLHIFQNNVLRMITTLPRVTSIDTLHEQTGKKSVNSYLTKIASNNFKNQFNDNEQIRQLGQYNHTHDELKNPRAML